MRGYFRILVVALLGVALLLSNIPVGSAGAPVTITVTNRKGWRSTEGIKANLPQFEKATGIKVNWIDIPPGELTAKTLAELEARTGAFDVIMASVEFDLAAYYRYLIPLDEFIVKKWGSVAAFKRLISPEAARAIVWEGKVYYIPFHGNVQFLIYRKKLFEDPAERAAFKKRFGYDLPTPPKTIKELVDVAVFFTRPEKNLWGLGIPLGGKYPQHFLEHVMLGAGIDVVDLKTRKPDFAEGAKRDRAVEIAQFLFDLLYKYKVIPPGAKTMGHVEMREIWKLGQLAMAFSWWGDHWDKLTSPEFVSAVGEVESAPFPQWPGGPPGRSGGRMSIWTVGIVGTTKNKDAAWKFIEWLISEENLQTEARTSGSASHWIAVDKVSAERGWLAKGLVEALPKSVPPRLGFLKEGPEIVNAFIEEAQALTVASVSPKAMVDRLAKRISEILKK